MTSPSGTFTIYTGRATNWPTIWGVFWSPRRGLRLTLRSGPALRLLLENGRRVTISVPDPAAAVAALSAD
jgi:hypothetical protein